jgi:hypothetical protein
VSAQEHPDPKEQPTAEKWTVRGVIGEILWGALFLIIVLGGIGMAFYNAEIPLPGAVPTPAATLASVSAQQITRCADGGCTTDPDDSCGQPAIRGLVMAGQPLYFTADHPAYAANKTLDPQRGDRWFCTVSQAEANGFRAAR